MICPKCKAKLRSEQMLSGQSGLLRQNGTGAVTLISGVTCWRCGYWRDDEVIPAMLRKIAPEPGETRPKIDCTERTATYHAVGKFFKNIAAQRASGASWYTVAQMLAQAGYRCQEKTLQKYFLLEQRKRCGDEETT